MALVINTFPIGYSSASGDLMFVVYESVKANDPVTYQDYKYVADVYIDTTLVARLKKVPDPDQKMGIFNISDIIRSYIFTPFNSTPLTLQGQQLISGEFFIEATVKFGEEYNNTLFTNVTVDSTRVYYNHYNGRMPGLLTILPDYLDKIATTRPIVNSISRPNTNNFLCYMPGSVSQYEVLIKSYNESGTNIGTISQNLTPSFYNAMQIINVGNAVINIISPGFINDSVKYFTVRMGASGNTVYKFNLICEPRFEIFTLHFLNKFGGFETREFTKVSRKSLAITKNSFGRLPYIIDNTGSVVYFSANKVYNETVATYASQYTEKLTLNTDVLTDSEYEWLGQLMVSPLVYVEIGGYHVPISITNNNYIFNKWVNDKITNLTIDIVFGDQFTTQFR